MEEAETSLWRKCAGGLKGAISSEKDKRPFRWVPLIDHTVGNKLPANSGIDWQAMCDIAKDRAKKLEQSSLD